ncbi:MAG: rod-binding protein [Pseudomonadota bacterium]
MTDISMISALQAQAEPQADLEGITRQLQSAKAEEARKAAEGFEAVFLNQFIGSMFEGISTDGLFGGGQAEKMWQGFLTEQIAEAFAKRGGIGVADIVMAQITQTSEGFDE